MSSTITEDSARDSERIRISTMFTRQVVRRLPAGAARAARLPFPPLAPQRLLATAHSPSPNDLFANGTNAYYADEMYRHWKQDPKSVHTSWDVYFSGLDKGLPSSKAFQSPPTYLPHPADGAPALHVSGGAELDVHLKVVFFSTVDGHPHSFYRAGATSCSRVSSARTPRCRARPSGNP